MNIVRLNTQQRQQLLWNKNITNLNIIAELSIQNKRKLLQKLKNKHASGNWILIIDQQAVTVFDFCVAQVLMETGKQKFKNKVQQHKKDIQKNIFGF